MKITLAENNIKSLEGLTVALSKVSATIGRRFRR